LATLYVWHPAVCTGIIGFFFPDEQYSISVRIGDLEHKLPLFYKRSAHENERGNMGPALVLCNIPTSQGVEHIKVFPDCLGVFQFPGKWFSVGRFSLMLREGARMTIPLEDDMKGWDREYHIEHRDNMFHFTIFPDEQKKDPISFAIPEKLLERVPCFWERASLKSLPDHQIIKPCRLLEK